MVVVSALVLKRNAQALLMYLGVVTLARRVGEVQRVAHYLHVLCRYAVMAVGAGLGGCVWIWGGSRGAPLCAGRHGNGHVHYLCTFPRMKFQSLHSRFRSIFLPISATLFPFVAPSHCTLDDHP